ncbi:MAG: hypothetical protein HY330_00475 [Chloroflexi bacterium]|nr:hypothetical protein [Chloroflexota bacterium]
MVSLRRLWGKGRAIPALSDAVAQELRARYHLDEGELKLLRSAERRGKFAGRPAAYVRVYRADRAQASSARVRSYEDLSLYPELVVYEGHVEQDGIYLVPRVQSSLPGPLGLRRYLG